MHELLAFVETVEPTCRDKGYNLYRYANCGDEENSNEINVLGHNWDDGEEITPVICEARGKILYLQRLHRL